MSTAIYTRDQVRSMDRNAIEEEGIPGLILMRRAAQAAYRLITTRWPDVKVVRVFCGSGNNAGDGYLLAGLLAERGYEVSVASIGDTDKLGADARAALQFCRQTTARINGCEDLEGSDGPGLLVDALLGTGFHGELSEPYLRAISHINGMPCPVLSLDVPSGLDADKGSAPHDCVQADVTITFIGNKRGLVTGEGCQLAGELVLDDLDVTPETLASVAPYARQLNLDQLLHQLPPRQRNAHKGMQGHLLLVGSDFSMPGALLMAAEAALRSGAGLVTLATRASHGAGMMARLPEAMIRTVEEGKDLLPLLEKANAVVLGPGLGQSEWSRGLVEVALSSKKPMVVDADALNILSSGSDLGGMDNCILTPHPGEAGRLLGIGSKAVQADRYAAVEQLHRLTGAVVLLKGAGTMIASAFEQVDSLVEVQTEEMSVVVCPYGNPGMAVAGMGDVLSGVIGGLLAQGLPLSAAACLGACVHARAADNCAREAGEIGMLATDLMPGIRGLLNGRGL